ncbi:aminotransferase class V-fold PLP-dependent enzyme [Gluconobacter cerinus]|uniref:cysteine desulfurase family protein n=1 Tax=Gluconobacter cerinus TaxID=38307 RepID=UPI001B8BE141|nr:aminotransferase class V-fold PLP-dependent enzyme [Gluconobacter cerinus]MBS1071535.1 aminotransferase class V-fold PLP-dependent enzyme [Gluconobacter cerinus]
MTNASAPTYLDANATEPLRPAAREAVLSGLLLSGNPSSVHAEGREARRCLEDARSRISAGFGRISGTCVFTSGGTEADAMAIHAFGQGRRILIGATEHDAVRKAAPNADVIPVNDQGILDLETLRQRLADGAPTLVCVMAANNETGVLSPLEDVAALCRDSGAHLHVDAVQSAGRLPFSLTECSVALSGHKMGGPKGAGALLLPRDEPIDALMVGGGQERGRRGGTQPLPAILGMAAAFDEAQAQDWSAIEALREHVEQVAMAAGARVAGGQIARLPNTSCLILDGVAAQVQLMTLDLEGFCVSAGSACSSGKVAASHVLTAMGETTGASQAIRVSLPWNVRAEQVDAFCDAYERMARRLSKR